MMRLFHGLCAWVVLGCSPVLCAELRTNHAPQRQIRFSTVKQASARREKLIRFIWAKALPTSSKPRVTPDVGAEALKKHLKGVDPSLAKRVDRLEVDVLGMTSLVYLMHPAQGAKTPPRFAIVHAGHSPRGEFLGKHYAAPIQLFLRRGYAVAMVHMPIRGWNGDGTAVLPNGKTVAVKSHADVVNLYKHDGALPTGAGFRPFLEPVVACIDHWAKTNDGNLDVTMIGLSGGGWTTHMAAAVDTRIRLSLPVAGAFPLYLRTKDRGSVGDLEQFFAPLYAEDIAPDGSGGGVATWLEIFALGAHGQGRRQVMVTAQYDSCCFRGPPKFTIGTFQDVVAESVKALGTGRWEHRLDTTHRSHTISPWILKKVVTPILPR